MTRLSAFGPVIGSALFVVLAALLIRASGMIRCIGDNRVAVVGRSLAAGQALPAIPTGRTIRTRAP